MPATVWRGRIAFGMVSIPVRLHKAARRERIRFHNVYRPMEASVSQAAAAIDDDESEVSAGGSGSQDEPPMSGYRGGTPDPAFHEAPEQVVRIHNAPIGGSN